MYGVKRVRVDLYYRISISLSDCDGGGSAHRYGDEGDEGIEMKLKKSCWNQVVQLRTRARLISMMLLSSGDRGGLTVR